MNKLLPSFKLLLASLTIPVVFCTAYAQVNLTSYFQFNEAASSRFNPALYQHNSSKGKVALLDVKAGFHSNFKYSDLIHIGTGIYADSLVLDFPKFRQAMEPVNHFSMASEFTLVDVSFKTGSKNNAFGTLEAPHYVTAGIRFRVLSSTHFNDEFVTLFTQGNVPSFTNPQIGTLALNATAMREISLSHGRRLSKRLWVGAAVKYLQGFYNITTNHFELELEGVDVENYIDVSTRAEILISGPVTFEFNQNQFISGADVDSVNSGFSDMYFSSGNPGYAVDLGVVYKPTDKLILSASLVDLGRIHWRNDAKIIQQSTDYRYHPADLSNSYDEDLENYKSPDDVFDDLVNDFEESFRAYEFEKSYTQSLPYQFYAGLEYTLSEKAHFGTLYTQQHFNGFTQKLFATSINASILNALNLSVNYVVDSKDGYFGAAGNIAIGRVQALFSLNSIDGFIDPANANTIAFQFGLRVLL